MRRRLGTHGLLLPLSSVALSALAVACGGGGDATTAGGGTTGGSAGGAGAPAKGGASGTNAGGGKAGSNGGASGAGAKGGSAGSVGGSSSGGGAAGKGAASGNAGSGQAGSSDVGGGAAGSSATGGASGSPAGGASQGGASQGGAAGSSAGGTSSGGSSAGGKAGASGAATCSAPLVACGGQCRDTTNDVAACGACDVSCGSTGTTAVACVSGVCALTCAGGSFDCDGDPKTGCESNAPCTCTPGKSEPCYGGPAETSGVGACKAGQKTCDATGLAFGACNGEVLPKPESCATPVDDDCDGLVNEEGTDCACVPGATQACGVAVGIKVNNVDPSNPDYSATAACKRGTQTCGADGLGFSACAGAVAPVPESCATAEDDNCNGLVNEAGPDSTCSCTPGETKACYEGAAGTQDVGTCKGGVATCKDDGSGFGGCVGQVVPATEICDGGLADEDCDGIVNEGGGDPTCICAAGSQRACYTGPAGTAGVGLCKTGIETCNAQGTAYEGCVGQVVPAAESCADGALADEDCDGLINEPGPDSVNCVCSPGVQGPCYDNGLDSPELKTTNGICGTGIALCKADGTGYGACAGQILPGVEVCDVDGVDEDCDNQVNEGGANCDCVPGSTASCFEGPANAVFGGNSICKMGTKTCNAAGKYGACIGQQLPQVEPVGVCTANIDEDCNGDSIGAGGVDTDGDGWTACGGDCCETTDQCTVPAAVNPGALDVAGNNLDDDCDGVKDNSPTTCDTGLASNSNNPLDYAKAMDLCQTTTESPPLASKKWGVISAALQRADGTGAPATESRSIRTGWGTVIKPNRGSSFAVLSTGNAADANDTNPPFASFQQGKDMGTQSGFPADWLAANGGNLPNAPGCPGPGNGAAAFDPVMLKIRVRVPTNAKSFTFNSYFLSAEYPEWVCTPFNDFFVALLTSSFSGQPANPVDKNLAFYDPAPAGAPFYPVGVNLAKLNTGLFQVCRNNRTIGCAGPGAVTITTCAQGEAALAGTGLDTTGNDCQSGDKIGGATGYLTSSGNVKPGETIEIRFAIWDTADHIYDSQVLLDNFQWSLNAAQPGTVGGGN